MQCPSCGSEVPIGFRFCGQCGGKLDAPVSASVRQPDERREVAVLFADISGFTAMSDRLDPEDVHRIMNQCFEGIGAVIKEEGGYIGKYIGDNVMALFGAPVAHEDDPARACRVGLRIQEFLGSFSTDSESELGSRLRARVGINYGLVVAGGVGSDARMDYTVMGDTVNLASRLESAAAPGTVLVSEAIWRSARRQFEFADPVELRIKGKLRSVRAYRLLQEVEAPPPGRRSRARSPRSAATEKSVKSGGILPRARAGSKRGANSASARRGWRTRLSVVCPAEPRLASLPRRA